MQQIKEFPCSQDRWLWTEQVTHHTIPEEHTSEFLFWLLAWRKASATIMHTQEKRDPFTRGQRNTTALCSLAGKGTWSQNLRHVIGRLLIFLLVLIPLFLQDSQLFPICNYEKTKGNDIRNPPWQHTASHRLRAIFYPSLLRQTLQTRHSLQGYTSSHCTTAQQRSHSLIYCQSQFMVSWAIWELRLGLCSQSWQGGRRREIAPTLTLKIGAAHCSALELITTNMYCMNVQELCLDCSSFAYKQKVGNLFS